jgi:hypothetical protein
MLTCWGTQCPGAKGGSSHSRTRVRGRRVIPGQRFLQGIVPGAQALHQCLSLGRAAGQLTHGADVGQNIGDGGRL